MKEIKRMAYIVNYTKWNGQCLTANAPTYESAKKTAKYFEEWERSAGISREMVIFYTDGTSERTVRARHIKRA